MSTFFSRTASKLGWFLHRQGYLCRCSGVPGGRQRNRFPRCASKEERRSTDAVGSVQVYAFFENGTDNIRMAICSSEEQWRSQMYVLGNKSIVYVEICRARG